MNNQINRTKITNQTKNSQKSRGLKIKTFVSDQIVKNKDIIIERVNIPRRLIHVFIPCLIISISLHVHCHSVYVFSKCINLVRICLFRYCSNLLSHLKNTFLTVKK